MTEQSVARPRGKPRARTQTLATNIKKGKQINESKRIAEMGYAGLG